MARMALTVVGGAVGAYFGGVQGAQIGAQIGSLAGALLFPPPDLYGPQITDTKVSPGTYGSPIAMCYGQSDFQADIIWVRGNQIDVRESSVSAGGKGGPKFVTSEAFGTWASLICDSEIDAVLRIFLGDELIYDGTSGALSAAISSGNPLPATGFKRGITARIYLGTTTQNPDPEIQAEDPFAPAWRGLAYIVFEEVPLARYGNRIPPVFIETAQSGTVSRLDVGLPKYTVASANNIKASSFDPARSRMFVAKDSLKVLVYDMITGEFVRQDDLEGTPNVWKSAVYAPLNEQPDFAGDFSASDNYNTVSPAVAPNGAFYAITEEYGGAFSFGSVMLVDSETGAWFATMSTDANLSFGNAMGYVGPTISDAREPTHHCIRAVDWLGFDSTTGQRIFLYLRAVKNELIFFGEVHRGMSGQIHSLGEVEITEITNAQERIYLDINKVGDKMYVVWNEGNVTTGNKLGRVPMSGLFDGGALPAELIVNVDSTIGVARDVLFDRVALTITVIGDTGIAVYDEDLVLVAATVADIRSNGLISRAGHIDGRVWFVSNAGAAGSEVDTLRGFSTATGLVEVTEDLTDWGLSDALPVGAIWRLRNDMWAGHAAGGSGVYFNQAFLLFGDRVAVAKVNLSDVLLDLAARSGVPAADLDVSAVTRTIYGAPQKSIQVNARGAWRDALVVTDHFAAMIDGKLTVKPNSTTSSGTITDTDLGSNGAPALVRRTNPNEVVRRFELTFKSFEANLEESNQADEFPIEVVDSGNVRKITTVVILDDDESWTATQRLFAFASSERTEMEITVPYTRGDIEPGDIWTISADGGSYDMRINEISGVREMNMKGTRSVPFLTGTISPIDSTRTLPVLNEISTTDFDLLDAHIFRNEDDGAEFTVVGWPRRAAFTWNHAIVFRSPDPFALDQSFATITSAAIVGAATDELGDVVSAVHWDRANSITLRMISGTPSSATEALVLAGSNPLWIQCGSTGEWELVQFANATENSDGTWTLDTFLRGQRGTEHLTGLHAPGDRVIWADANTALRKGGSDVGTQLFYASTTLGAVQDITTLRAFTNTSRGLRPYSVTDVLGTRDGSGNLTITWVRRTRLAGAVNNITVPLGESSEEYEVDIIDAVGSPTFLRPVTGLTTPTLSYTAAEQITDFGSIQSSVTVRIYQISATFGRGVVKEATI